MNNFPWEPGIHHLELQDPDSRLTLSLPQNLGKSQPLGLVIALHYAGHGRPFFGSSLLTGLVEPGLRKLGAIIAAPDCPDVDWDTRRSKTLVLDLLSLLSDIYPVAEDSVLMTGYSIGGIGAWSIAGSAQEKFSAALPMAAQPPQDVLDLTWNIPLRVIHGSRDELFPIVKTREVVKRLNNRGVDISLDEVADAGHFETGKFYRPLISSVSWIHGCWSAQRGDPTS